MSFAEKAHHVPTSHPLRTPYAPRNFAVAGAAALVAAAVPAVASSSASGDGKTAAAVTTASHSSPMSTVLLVHGAWADSSSWRPVIDQLQAQGYPVQALANPLRGLTSDAAYVKSRIESVEGPVVLVGHSYGGSVISEAAAQEPNVKALVYVAAFAPDKGETIGALAAKDPGSHATPDALTSILLRAGVDVAGGWLPVMSRAVSGLAVA